MNETKNNHKKCIIMISALLLVTIILLLFMCYHHCSCTCQCMDITDKNIPLPTTDELIDGALTREQKKLIEPDYFNVKINPTPELVNGKMNIHLENPSNNIYSCRVEIVLDESSKNIYLSPVITPNKTLEHCSIREPLNKGIHKAMVKYVFFEIDTEKVVGQCNVKINIKSK